MIAPYPNALLQIRPYVSRHINNHIKLKKWINDKVVEHYAEPKCKNSSKRKGKENVWFSSNKYPCIGTSHSHEGLMNKKFSVGIARTFPSLKYYVSKRFPPF